MASKRSVTERRGPDKAPKVKVLIKLSRRATRDVKKLLKQSEAGTLTNAELDTGLKDAEIPLQQMLDYINVTLEDVSKLLKEGKTIKKKELKTKLKKVKRRMQRMFNHSGPSK